MVVKGWTATATSWGGQRVPSLELATWKILLLVEDTGISRGHLPLPCYMLKPLPFDTSLLRGVFAGDRFDVLHRGKSVELDTTETTLPHGTGPTLLQNRSLDLWTGRGEVGFGWWDGRRRICSDFPIPALYPKRATTWHTHQVVFPPKTWHTLTDRRE